MLARERGMCECALVVVACHCAVDFLRIKESGKMCCGGGDGGGGHLQTNPLSQLTYQQSQTPYYAQQLCPFLWLTVAKHSGF